MIKQRAVSEKQKALRRRQILQATLRLFETMPYESVGMAGVARQSGIAKGTVYLYFKTKEALFLALQTEAFEAWFDTVDAAFRAKEGFYSTAEFVEIIAQSLQARPALVRLLAISHTILERNIEYESALEFKRLLLRRVEQTGGLIESRLPFLGSGQGARLLLRIHALAIGIQHLAEPAPVVCRVLEKPELALFKIDFFDEFLATLTVLMDGLERENGRQ